jgi:hypothetical protein
MNPLIHAAIVRAQASEIALAADRRRHIALPPRAPRADVRAIAGRRLAIARLGRRAVAQAG